MSSPAPLVVMPGTGSDDDYCRRAFGPAAGAAGRRLLALSPDDDLVDGYLRRLDAAGADGPILVGGVSIGASIATRWALTAGPDRCAGVWAVLPPWSGPPEGSPAAASANATADGLERDGLAATITSMTSSSPDWLAAELTRSWTALYPGLVAQLRAAATLVGPTPDEIGSLSVPLSVVVSAADPIHPAVVGEQWAAAAPRSAVRRTTLAAWGRDPALLGRLAAAGWAEAAG
ncbi:MAG: alpha/beta hydrolase [Gordonia sp. (in: high G+C Gram-positive bacteria)]|uniref:alpha/beta fold hydrolase n=1 Tax=Gordonia sp. (in: high G+C Gram-positive bacteria) TaxID=84139 RepID=UPI0039E302FE